MNQKKLYRHLPLLVLALSLLILFYRLTFLGEVLWWGLPSLQFYPWHEMAADSIRMGSLPLWNPLVGNGAPLLANYQTAVFYPPNWLYLIMPTEYAMGWVGILHLFWAGWGMRTYLRGLGIGVLGQSVGTLAFTLSGYLVARFWFLSVISAVVWLPWLFWGIDNLFRAADGKDRLSRPFVIVAGIVAMLLLAGHAQTASYILLFAGVYTLWLIIPRLKTDSNMALKFALSALLAVVLGVVVASVQLLPTLELMQTSQRSGGVDQSIALIYSFWPWRILGLLVPNLFGSPTTGDFWGDTNYWEDAVYVGLFALFMAFKGLYTFVRTDKDERSQSSLLRHIPFFWISTLIIFILMLGHNTPIFPYLFDHVGFFRLFNAPTRWSILFVFSLSALGAIGVEAWQSTERGRFWTRLGIAGGVAVIVTAWLVGQQGVVEATFLSGFIFLGVWIALLNAVSLLRFHVELHYPQKVLMWQIPLLLILAADLMIAHWGLTPTINAEFYNQTSLFVETLEEGNGGGRVFYLPEEEEEAQLGTFFDLRDFKIDDDQHWNGLRQSMLPNLNMLDGVPSSNNFDPLLVGAYTDLMAMQDGSLDQLASMGVAVLLTQYQRDDLEFLAYVSPIYAYAVPDTWSRFSLVDCTDTLNERMCNPVSDGHIEIVRDDPNSQEFIVETTEGTTLLILDTYYPGWQAAIDGQPTTIHRANTAFRAVDIPAGDHTITFDYRPRSFQIGLSLSAISLLVLLSIWHEGRIRGWLQKPTPPSQ